MAIARLEDRTDRLFGREADLARLCERARRTGLTAVIGPPQIGKSWLLMELARWLDRETKPRCLVGFTRSPKGANDPLLQVVSDLYQRWLADADARQQAHAFWEQQKDRFLPAFARFVGKLSEKAGKLVPFIGELGGTAIKEALEGLVVASEDLRAGGLIVSKLEYLQGQELVNSVHDIAKRPIALVMDQWEETRDRDLVQQRNTFRDFLREPEQWPECHILLGAREGGDAAKLLEELQREFPGDAHVYMLGEMDLAAEIERRRLVSFLHAQPQLRTIENVDDNRVLDLIGGYPRVISRWVADDARETVRTFGGLERLTKEAHEYRYSDLEKLLLALDGDRRRLAMRISLVPLVEDPDAWRMLQGVILADLDPNALDDLKIDNILDREAEPPRFGHPKRREAARTFLDAWRRQAVRAEAQLLIFALARSITGIDASRFPYVASLVDLREEAQRRGLPSLPLALCEAASTLLGERLPSPDSLVEGAREAGRSREAGLGLVLAAALFNTMYYATQSEDDLAGRDALLGELRALARAFPDDAAVREFLSRGLFNAQNVAKAQGDLARRDALLDELRALARAFPDDAAVRGPLAMAVFNTLNDAKAEDDRARRDALLDELRALARAFPDDAAIRGFLSRGLFDTLKCAKAENDLPRRDALLDELRALARSYPVDDAVLEKLALGLYSAMMDERLKADAHCANAHYYSLRDEYYRVTLARMKDDTVRQRVAVGPLLLPSDELLDALAELAYFNPEHAASLGARSAVGLFIMLTDAMEKNDPGRRDAALDKSRALARTFPDDAMVRQSLAMGLFNTLIYAKAENDLARVDALLEELRALAGAYPEDSLVQELLAEQQT